MANDTQKGEERKQNTVDNKTEKMEQGNYAEEFIIRSTKQALNTISRLLRK